MSAERFPEKNCSFIMRATDKGMGGGSCDSKVKEDPQSKEAEGKERQTL